MLSKNNVNGISVSFGLSPWSKRHNEKKVSDYRERKGLNHPSVC